MPARRNGLFIALATGRCRGHECQVLSPVCYERMPQNSSGKDLPEVI